MRHSPFFAPVCAGNGEMADENERRDNYSRKSERSLIHVFPRRGSAAGARQDKHLCVVKTLLQKCLDPHLRNVQRPTPPIFLCVTTLVRARFDFRNPRRILHFNVTHRPTSEWVVQQLREAFPEAGHYRFVILDHDSKFNEDELAFLQATGLQAKRTSSGAMAKRHCGALGRRLPPRDPGPRHRVNASHLRRLIRDYTTYYLEDRIHDGLDKDTPNRRLVECKPSPVAKVTCQPRLGGLHHRYRWSEAA